MTGVLRDELGRLELLGARLHDGGGGGGADVLGRDGRGDAGAGLDAQLERHGGEACLAHDARVGGRAGDAEHRAGAQDLPLGVRAVAAAAAAAAGAEDEAEVPVVSCSRDADDVGLPRRVAAEVLWRLPEELFDVALACPLIAICHVCR